MQNLRLTQQNEVLTEKAEYTDKVLASETGHPTTIIAKELGIHAQALNAMLQVMGVQYKTKSGEWVLKAAYQDKGYHISKTFAYMSSDGFTPKTAIRFLWT